ncbi:hypothetical protein PFISCL1PPCAC_3869, partial [Pristionchus fissidentatus]
SQLIANAIHHALRKPAKIPAEYIDKLTHDMAIGDGESVKINLSLKHGLVIDIDDDSQLSSFLSIGDVLLTVNDKVVSKPDFKLQDQFKDKAAKTLTFTYIRFKAFLQEEPKIDDADRRDNFAYRFGVIYLYQSMHFGLVFQGHEGRV